MRKSYIRSLLLVFMVILFSSCDDDNNCTDHNYYVQYSVGIKPGDEVEMSVRDINGHKTIQQTSYEATVTYTVGPVKEGFEAVITASVNGGHTAEYLRIDVSHNSEPFVTKRYIRNGNTLYYTIGEK